MLVPSWRSTQHANDRGKSDPNASISRLYQRHCILIGRRSNIGKSSPMLERKTIVHSIIKTKAPIFRVSNPRTSALRAKNKGHPMRLNTSKSTTGGECNRAHWEALMLHNSSLAETPISFFYICRNRTNGSLLVSSEENCRKGGWGVSSLNVDR